jgi:hypothetical protein
MSWRFAPHPGKQTEFFTHPAYEVGYGGSAGSGKSLSMLYHFCYLLDFEEQRYRRGEIKSSSVWVGYFRRVMPNLRQVVESALRTFTLIDPSAKWNANDHVWKFGCGMHFLFGAMEKEHDYLKYYSWEFQEQLFDELSEFSEEQWDQLGTRVRSPDPALRPFMNRRWGSNPTGPGLLWVRRRFVDIYKELNLPVGTTIRVKTPLGDGREYSHDQVFIQAYLSDNPSLAADGQYEATLRRTKPHIYKALLEGNWYYTSGGLLSQYWREDHHVVDNHKIPPNVFRFRSGDWGLNNYTSITWWYVDHDGQMTAYYHLYVKNMTVQMVSQAIKEIETYFGDWDEDSNRSMLRRSPLDAKAFHRDPSGNTNVADEFRRHGIQWIPSIKDRFNGIAEVVRRLDYFVDLDTGQRINVEQVKAGMKVKPMIRWMRRCEAPRRLLPILPQDPNNPGDVAKGSEDDVLDDLQYAVSSNPLKARLAVVRDTDDYDEEEQYASRFNRKGGLARLHGQR